MLSTSSRVFHTVSKSSKKVAPLLNDSPIPISDALRMAEFITWTLQHEIFKKCNAARERKGHKEQRGILASLASQLYCLCVRFFIVQLCDVLQKRTSSNNAKAIVGYVHHFHHVLTEYDITEQAQTDINQICSRTLLVLEPLWAAFQKGLKEGEHKSRAWDAFDSENPSEEIVKHVAPAHLSSAKEVGQQSINYRMAYTMMIGLETSIRVEEGVRLLSFCPYGVGEFNAELEKQIALLGFSFAFPLRLNDLCPHEQSVEMATDVVNLVLSALTMNYRIPPAGSLVSPRHVLADADAAAFEEVAPALFSQVRRECGVESADYAWSIAHRGFKFVEFSTNSKSGETFFFSHDGRFIVKTISAKEAEVLVRMLPAYMSHLRRGASLLMRICGLYRVGLALSSVQPKPRFFIVALSVFDCGGLGLHAQFDLKGSTRGRKAKAGESVQKDRDWLEQERKMELPVGLKRKLNSAAEDDARFLASQGVLDYSLLLGLHDTQAAEKGRLNRGVELVTKAVQHRLMPLIRTVLAFKPHDADPNLPALSLSPRPAHPPPAHQPPATSEPQRAVAREDSAGEGAGERGRGTTQRLWPLPPVRPPAKRGAGRTGDGAVGGMLMGAGSMHHKWQQEMGASPALRSLTPLASLRTYNQPASPALALPGAHQAAREEEEEEEAAAGGQGPTSKRRKSSVGSAGEAAGGRGPRQRRAATESELLAPAGRGPADRGHWAGPHGPISAGTQAGLGGRGRYVYFVGIVDFLIPWDGYKKMEFGLNLLRGNRAEASCVPPAQYAQRQMDFIGKEVLGMCTVNFAVQYGKRSERGDKGR